MSSLRSALIKLAHANPDGIRGHLLPLLKRTAVSMEPGSRLAKASKLIRKEKADLQEYMQEVLKAGEGTNHTGYRDAAIAVSHLDAALSYIEKAYKRTFENPSPGQRLRHTPPVKVRWDPQSLLAKARNLLEAEQADQREYMDAVKQSRTDHTQHVGYSQAVLKIADIGWALAQLAEAYDRH